MSIDVRKRQEECVCVYTWEMCVCVCVCTGDMYMCVYMYTGDVGSQALGLTLWEKGNHWRLEDRHGGKILTYDQQK